MSSLVTHAPTSEPIVTILADQPVTDSRDVASYFRKNHKDVLRGIRELHCSPDFRQRNFAPFKIKDLTGETTSHVMMTRDGFTFLVMGFTGETAARFKEAYIARFNAIEAELRAAKSRTVPDLLSDPAALRQLLLGTTEKVLALEGRVEVLEPKAEALDRIATAQGSMCITDAAKALQVPPRELSARLRTERWTYRRVSSGRDVAMQTRIDVGDLETKVVRVERPRMSDLVTEQVRITPRGLTKLAAIINPAATLAL